MTRQATRASAWGLGLQSMPHRRFLVHGGLPPAEPRAYFKRLTELVCVRPSSQHDVATLRLTGFERADAIKPPAAGEVSEYASGGRPKADRLDCDRIRIGRYRRLHGRLRFAPECLSDQCGGHLRRVCPRATRSLARVPFDRADRFDVRHDESFLCSEDAHPATPPSSRRDFGPPRYAGPDERHL